MKFAAFVVSLVVGMQPAVLGTMKPAEAVTADRVKAVVPAAERGAWLEYLRRSQRQKVVDEDAIVKEQRALRAKHLLVPPLPAGSTSGKSIPNNRAAEFYATAEAKRVGDTIVSFQIPAGGWSKNIDMSGPPRAFGQSYVAGEKKGSSDASLSLEYFGTIDNDATTAEMRFLGRLSEALPGEDGEVYRKSFMKGVQYLLAAQYPNGGWPQIWPLQGGYHDAITLNDDAMALTMEVLTDVAAGNAGYGFVPDTLRAAAQGAVARGLACFLHLQILLPAVAKGPVAPTIWAQQYDALTMQPAGARNFEPVALSTAESAHVVLYLMSLAKPSAQVVVAVESAEAWLKAHAISGKVWAGKGVAAAGMTLQTKEAAPLLWPRYYSLGAQTPIFGDRDRTIHDDVSDLSFERRNGYAWYGTVPQHVLDRYETWEREVARR